MSIDAKVKTVHHYEDGSGQLDLVGRKPGENPGQPVLSFKTAPHEVTALNGLEIWGGANGIMLGEIEIAKRIGYTRIEFCDDETFKNAVKDYHQRHQTA